MGVAGNWCVVVPALYTFACVQISRVGTRVIAQLYTFPQRLLPTTNSIFNLKMGVDFETRK